MLLGIGKINSQTPQPILNAVGNQIYCAGTDLKIATSFSITPSSIGEIGQPAIYIQISEGYDNGQDILDIPNLLSNHPNIKISFNAQFGKLTIESNIAGGLINYNDIEKALLDVIFRTNSNSVQTRKFSITIGQADYLPSNDHYYKYIPFPTNSAGNVVSKSWTDSRAEAETIDYYGRKGYLVTLRSEAEAALASDQAPGRGWIGASDANQEGKWEWVTEPGGSIHFWSGNYVDGNGPCDNLVGNCQAVNGEYNNWAGGEPNEYNGAGISGEDYGHIYGNGTWNDYPNFRNDIQGYVVEFGGRPGDTPLTITDFTQIDIPQIISKVENEICGSGQVTLSAETNTKAPNDLSNDVRIEWYDQPTGGTLIKTTESGENFITPVISVTTDYYIQAVKFDGTSYCPTGSVREKITATFSPKPVLVSIPDVEQCNDIVFDLEALQDDISSNYANEDFEFYDSSGNLIPKADWNTYQLPDLTVSNEELITVVVKNGPSLGSPCDQTTTFTLRAGACDIPTTFPITDEITCETDSSALGNNQDGVETFVNAPTFFATLKSDLETANPLFLTSGTSITFYGSDADATAGSNAIDVTLAYTTDDTDPGFSFNTAEDRWEQEVWVRVENTTLTAACVETQQVGRFIINKLPELKVTSYEFNQCNNSIFNLTTLENDLAVSHGSLTFNWFDSNANPITNPIQYQISNLTNFGLFETVTVEISTNPTLGSVCISPTILSIDLRWSTTILPSGFNPTDYDQYSIETDPDPTGQGQDGIETFNNAFYANIQAGLIAAEPLFFGKNFSFYRSENDALIEDDIIDTTVDFTTDPSKSGFTFNPTENRWEQEIWVYVSDQVTTAITTCFGLYQVATLYIEKRPVVYPIATQELCDDGTTSGEKLDGLSVFDTSSILTELITDPATGTAQNSSLFTAEYTYVDAIGATVTTSELPDSSNLLNSPSQTVTVTFTNNTTNTTAGIPGSSTGPVEFIVYKTPVAYPTDPATGLYEIIDCDDVASGSDDDGATLFDITNIKDLLLTDPSGVDPIQASADYDFTFTDASGNPVTLVSDYRAEDGDTIDVTITNPLSTSCSETITIEFTVNPLPSFEVDDDTIVCLNYIEPEPIGVTSSKDDYTYEWTHTDNNGVNSPFAPNDPNCPDNSCILIGVGGTYYVTATDKITGCTRTLSIDVDESIIATITLDDITVDDLTSDNNNTITIDPTNLGIGDYEYAIDDPTGPYQNEPFFEKVRPGIHTIYVRDKNDCGIAQIEVSVIGYKQFFTPNGDGIHDNWRILGIRKDFQPNSKVYIFDRYGKLIKELDPITEGWDGTYLGRPMPQTDYWFRVFLEDGREFSGHFSLIRGID